MTEAEMIQFLLSCLIGVVGFFGVGVITLLWYLYQTVSKIGNEHGARLAVLENTLSIRAG